MDKIIIAIGGGEIKNKTTLKIDEYIANLAKAHAGEKRAVGLFLGTASHDSMPYFNSFRKTYTSVFDIKAECALTVYGEMNFDHIKEKFDKADMIYIGGGDTKFMLEKWQESGIINLVLDAYNRGVIIAGLSAGAICWFKNMYSDYDLMRNGENGEYKILDGLGILEGTCSPHYNERIKDYHETLIKNNLSCAIGIENDCAVVYKNGELLFAVSSGGKAYSISVKDGVLTTKEIKSNE